MLDKPICRSSDFCMINKHYICFSKCMRSRNLKLHHLSSKIINLINLYFDMNSLHASQILILYKSNALYFGSCDP